MKVDVYQAFLTVEGKKVRLTKAVARQFPVRSLSDSRRDGSVGTVKDPQAKVMGVTLGSPASWLYLVVDEEAGLAWEPACTYQEDYAEQMRERGCNVDDPASVPTVIL